MLPVAYVLIPGLIGVAAISLFLMRRRVAPVRVWPIGFVLVTALVAGTSWWFYAPFRGQVQATSFVMAFAVLYYPLFIILTGAALAFRTRLHSRGLGVAFLVGLLLGTGVLANHAAAYFLDFVNASG